MTANVARILSQTDRPTKFPEIIRLAARRGDPGLVAALLRLGDEPGWTGAQAVLALGDTPEGVYRAEVIAALRRFCEYRDADMASAAISAYIRLLGSDTIADVRAFLEWNRTRPDGQGHRVNMAAVVALGELGTKDAADLLIGELVRVTEPDWLPDYGSAVVTALLRLDEISLRLHTPLDRMLYPQRGGASVAQSAAGYEMDPNARASAATSSGTADPASPTGLRGPFAALIRAALTQYADGLSVRAAGLAHDPVGRRYLYEKAEEARMAAASDRSAETLPR